jgi:hypothetical protein
MLSHTAFQYEGSPPVFSAALSCMNCELQNYFISVVTFHQLPFLFMSVGR